jgi:hypothetical protein
MGYGTEKRSWEEGYMVIWGTVQRRGVGRRDTYINNTSDTTCVTKVYVYVLRRCWGMGERLG